MPNPIDDYMPEEYAHAIDDYLLNYVPPLTVSVHPRPESDAKVDKGRQLYDQIYHARRAPLLQSLAFTVRNLLYAYFNRGRRQ